MKGKIRLPHLFHRTQIYCAVMAASNGVSLIFTISAEDGSTAQVHSQGAHLTSWKGTSGDERLYTSPAAVYKEGVAIRGGVPLIFPAFGNNQWQTHGVARNKQFKCVCIEGGRGMFVQEYRNDDPVFPDLNCDLLITVDVSDAKLLLGARVVNHKEIDSGKEFSAFQFAFHTYFKFSDVENVELSGFDGVPFFDSLLQDKEIVNPGETRLIRCEIDRQYRNVAAGRSFSILDNGFAPGRARKTVVSGSGSMPDVVLWNPWIEKNMRLTDLEKPDGYRKFVCIEHAVIDKKIPLSKTGVVWEGQQEISSTVIELSKI